MPNRILRDWTDSEKVNALSVHAERFFVRLIMKVDDYGRYSANVKLLKSSLYPFLIDEVREADISRWTTECEKAGLILLYVVASKPYLQIDNFKQTLRQKTEKYPPPESRDEDAKQMHSIRIADANTKRNEVETKQKQNPKPESGNEGWDFVNENFKSVFEKWMRYKASRREKYKSLESAELCYEKLLKFSNGDPVLAMDIVEDAMSKNYSGFFELKNNHQKNDNKFTTADHKIGRNTKSEIENFLEFGNSLDKMAKAGQVNPEGNTGG